MGSTAIPRSIIRYSGLFDFDGLYSSIIDWCKNQGFMWHEMDYKHKVPGPEGAEQEWVWKMDKTVNDYIQFNYDDFRDLTVSASPGNEPLYSFNATVIRAFASLWF